MWILNVECWSDCWMVEVSPCFTLYHAECLLLVLVHSHLICTTFHNPGDTGDTDQYQELCPPTPTIIPIKHYCVALPSKLRIRIYILRGRISLYCLQTAWNAAWSETISTNCRTVVLIHVIWECHSSHGEIDIEAMLVQLLTLVPPHSRLQFKLVWRHCPVIRE